MGFADKKETRQEAKERREQENQDLKDEKRRIKNAIREKAEKELKEEARRSVVLKQPKTPKAQPIHKESESSKRDARMVERKRKDLSKSGAELKKLGERAKTIVSKIEINALGGKRSGIVWINSNERASIIRGIINSQGGDICNERLALSVSQILKDKSLAMLSRAKVSAILTYTEGEKVKINQVCSNIRGSGATLVRALFKKYPNKQFTLDAVSGAIRFWTSMGFDIVGERKTGTKLTKMIKN